MRVISKKSLEAFWLKHPAARVSLESWYRVVHTSTFASFAELRNTFGSADYVTPYIVFNVGGNNFRIVAAVHFNRQKLYIREVFTHAQYDRWNKSSRSTST